MTLNPIDAFFGPPPTSTTSSSVDPVNAILNGGSSKKRKRSKSGRELSLEEQERNESLSKKVVKKAAGTRKEREMADRFGGGDDEVLVGNGSSDGEGEDSEGEDVGTKLGAVIRMKKMKKEKQEKQEKSKGGKEEKKKKKKENNHKENNHKENNHKENNHKETTTPTTTEETTTKPKRQPTTLKPTEMSSLTNNEATLTGGKKNRPKVRSRQKNIKKDTRTLSEKPDYLLLGKKNIENGEGYRGRPMTKQTQEFLKKKGIDSRVAKEKKEKADQNDDTKGEGSVNAVTDEEIAKKKGEKKARLAAIISKGKFKNA